MQSVEWCLRGLSEAKVLLREGAAVLPEVIKTILGMVHLSFAKDALLRNLREVYR